MSDEAIALKIGRDEALVLFELLADFYSQPVLEIPTVAERLALVRLHGELEKTLVEPFRPDYKQLLESARAHLREQAGSK
jgi:hypothetical protein